MAHTQHSFHTDGSNALKAQEAAYDVFVKPQFSSERSVSIIDFEDARHGIVGQIGSEETPLFTLHGSDASDSLASRIVSKIKGDHLLKDLFSQQKKGSYRSADLALFAKGFTFCGLATFVMILFGA